MNSADTPVRQVREPSWLWTVLWLVIGCWLMAACWHEWLSDPQLAANFDSESGRRWLIKQLGGKLTGQPPAVTATVPFENVLGSNIVFTLLWWLGGATILAHRQRSSWNVALLRWGAISARWWLLAGSWTIFWTLATLSSWETGAAVLAHLPEMWLSFASAGWLTSFVCQTIRWRPAVPSTSDTPTQAGSGSPSVSLAPGWGLWMAIGLYTLIFGAMNTWLYQNLLVPHGDSAMYEEHLWNLLHGKGFRSFIDKGLFLGEHIQVIHLGLIPVYLLWPSHILLEWCESLALALGAIPVYQMVVRQQHPRWQATCLALAYLLYVPMQRLDISIDFKTFRPEAFGIPLLLAALNSLEGRQWGRFALWSLAALLVKEDYAIIFGPLGLWIAWREFRRPENRAPRWRSVWPGLLIAAGSVLYLWWAIKVVIPYYKAGHEVHYARYFSRFGETTNEILWNFLRHPDWLVQELVTAENVLFAAALGFSLAGLPLWSPGRLLVGLPLFAALCLNQIARNTQHHFHAPLVAIAFWAAAHGISQWHRWAEWLRRRTSSLTLAIMTDNGARFATIMALFASSGFHFWHSLSPGGLPFWDTQSPAYWKRKYVRTPRAAEFSKVLQLIPPEKHVASTDFIHPRFNHHARSYDYSGYRPDVPDDVEFLVIDVRGPYSTIQTPDDVDEYQKHPERWELLPDSTQGYFYVFQRRREATAP